ncbi:hypothetical protein [Crossiella cryophila]|uniref:Uncharacterized protein n=1 Tax=Crossiella cryophila TaxID=43355 RepID=A0A7W7CLQ5_9PSEU|nr:hypothetical protein [Crossiella cryophila]MBB4681754.1 hypothetical protein [Crossiella cryophila]
MAPDGFSVDTAVEAVEAAIAAKKLSLLEAAYHDLASAPTDVLAAHSATIGPRLTALLPEMPQWHSAVYAVFVGALVEWQADAVACAPPILDGLQESLEDAIEFARLWRNRFGEDAELPEPTEMPSEEVQDRLGPDFGDVWHAPYFGWHTVHKWEMAAVAVLADRRVRRGLTNRDELLALIDRLEPDYGDLRCVQWALLLLDEEPLLVLDRASGRAFRMRMSGIAGNYQLQTLLAGALIGGGHLPGTAPSAEAVALSSVAEIDMKALDELPHTVECFNFAEPSGRWIWGESTPSRIPVVDGIRRLVLDPPVFTHAYQAVRFLPRVPGRLDLEEILEPAEAAPYFAGVQELMSVQEASRLAADGY